MSSDRRPLSELERAEVVRYVDGRMEPGDEAAFEARIAEGGELGQAVEEFMDVDFLLRSDRGSIRRSGRGRILRKPWAKLALGAAAVAAFLFFLAPEHRDRVVLVAHQADRASFMREHRELRGSTPPWADHMRSQPSGSEEEEMPAQTFLEEVAGLQDQLLDQGSEEVSSVFFLVPLNLVRPASVVVIGVPENGDARWLFPDDERVRTGLGSGEGTPALAELLGATRLGEGRHCLPSLPVIRSAVEQERVEFVRGFVIEVGEVELVVLVGIRGEPLTPGDLQAIDGLVRQGPKAGTAAGLARLGFELHRLRVRDSE